MTTSAIPDPSLHAGDLRARFDAQHAASRKEAAPAPLAARLEALDKVAALVREHATRFVDAISADYGNRSRHETEIMEVVPVLDAVRYAKKNLARWTKPEKRPTDLSFKPATSWIRWEPLGVVGIISPWNYPLVLALAPLVDALAAGNRVMLKPSELTPTFSALLQELIAERFAPEQVTVATGDPDVASAFSALPFDHLMFTGSTAIGRKVAQAAAANLTPVTLELGGKSPAIVCADYPLERAAQSIAFGKFLNAGQTCIAPDYALVPAAQARDFADAVMTRVRKSYPKIAGNADYTSVITERHRTRLVDGIKAAQEAGAAVWTHGSDAADDSGRLPPTVIMGAPADGMLLREEIFGPVLPIIPYEDLDAALATIRTGERPLALYCFTNDKATEACVLDGAMSGGVTVNGTILHVAQHALPFGGVGASGSGAYHGRDGFRRFSHARAVHRIGRFSALEKMGPPWGRIARFTIAMLKRGK